MIMPAPRTRMIAHQRPDVMIELRILNLQAGLRPTRGVALALIPIIRPNVVWTRSLRQLLVKVKLIGLPSRNLSKRNQVLAREGDTITPKHPGADSGNQKHGT
jgi:hypothetical protein